MRRSHSSATAPRSILPPRSFDLASRWSSWRGSSTASCSAQELADLAAVVTLGSASARPEGSTYLAMLPAPTWFIATDADEAGDKAASGWPARARRVRPPAPCKDWTEAFQYPINLRRWWTDRLGGIEAPALSTWDELALRRWGPAVGDPDPGIIIDGPLSASC